MRAKQFVENLTQSFAFGKLLPGILIGLFAAEMSASRGEDESTFLLSMVVFWAAIGIGHGIAQLATERLEPSE
jgi:hypothetical protein